MTVRKLSECGKVWVCSFLTAETAKNFKEAEMWSSMQRKAIDAQSKTRILDIRLHDRGIFCGRQIGRLRKKITYPPQERRIINSNALYQLSVSRLTPQLDNNGG